MLVNATSSDPLTGPPGRFGSAESSCQAQNSPVVPNPSGWVPVGETTAYWVSRLDACVVFPKCFAALIASAASCLPVAVSGAAPDSSTQTPASAPPAGYATCEEFAGQDAELYGTPSQYCVITPDQRSLPVPRPLNSSWR